MIRRSLPILFLLLACALRLHWLGHQSFWNDEGNSARLVERSIPTLLAGAAGDIHPPGYYLLLAGWRGWVGTTEFGLRSLSALQGILSLAVLYGVAKRWFGRTTANATLLLAAINPLLVYYSQEARMYAQLGLSASLLLASAASFLQKPTFRSTLWLSLATAAGLYTHYAFPLLLFAVLAGLAIAWLVQARSQSNISAFIRPMLLLASAQGLALIFFLPWLGIAWRQVRGWPLTAGSAVTWQAGLMRLWQWLWLGQTVSVSERTLLAGLLAFAVLVGVGWWWDGLANWRGKWLALSAALLPSLFLLTRGLTAPQYAKFLLMCVPAWLLLAGHGLAVLGQVGWQAMCALNPRNTCRVPLGTALLGAGLGFAALAVVFHSVGSLQNLYTNPTFARADYRAIANQIRKTATAQDTILLVAPNQWEVFTYYYPDNPQILPLPRTRPLAVDTTLAELQQTSARSRYIYTLFWGAEQADPQGVIETWLAANLFKVSERWVGDVRFGTWSVPLQTDVPATPSHTPFTDSSAGASILLENFTLSGTTFAPGEIVQVALSWTSAQVLTRRYKVFVHFTPQPGQPPLAQSDSEPAGGTAMTTNWQAHQPVRDLHGIILPENLPSGDYWLVLGLYDSESSVRLRLPDGTDRLALAQITVR
ncbi:MAG TPA: glycosyltransferase family 39 protein [Anaerolineales bacterium]|nr:glycosyltransferase family 39 protein [Anaerolineales bacterium]